MASVQAICFDVFGTLVDWRSGVAREAKRVIQPRGYSLDWTAFADAWRAEYQPGMEEVRSGRIPFCKLDELHRRNLERFIPRFGLRDLSHDVLNELTLAWHKLDAWPDVPAALARLKPKYLLAPVSNGNISLMVDLARRNKFPWDAILGAEVAGDYKPKPRVYLAACGAFDLDPAKCMMVAAHGNDLAPLRRVVCVPVTLRGPTNMGPALASGADGAGRCRRRDLGDLPTSSEAEFISLCRPARAARRNSPRCDRPSCNSSAGSSRAKCRT